jgi:predicted metal-dependent hydrolase
MPRQDVRDQAASLDLPGGAIAFTIRRSARRRRTITLTVGREGVVVAAPLRASLRDIHALVIDRAEWIRRHLATPAPQGFRFEDGALLPVDGKQVRLAICASDRRATVSFDGETLSVTVPEPADEPAVRAAVLAWYRDRTARRAAVVVPRWAFTTGLEPSRVFIRDQKHRWGSCGPDGVVRLNLRLTALRDDLFDYVVLHELAHIRHPHHGPAFWAEVERWHPAAVQMRAELKAVRVPF